MAEIDYFDEKKDYSKIKIAKLKEILRLPSKRTLTLLIGVPNSGNSTLATLMLE